VRLVDICEAERINRRPAFAGAEWSTRRAQRRSRKTLRTLRVFNSARSAVICIFDFEFISATYAVGNKQYVVVSLNAEEENNFKGGYVAFAIP